jgi:transcriptional regulator with XRE-family HTH domain
MPNDVLRRAIAEAKMTERQLAERIGADPKTVSRWVAEEHRTPHPRLRWQVSETLGVDEMELWPQAVRAAIKTGPDREIAAVYPAHAAVPDSVWRRLISDATREIMLCGYAPYWLWWQIPDLSATLRTKVEAGCRVRVIIGEPTMSLVASDEAATGAPLTLTARIEQTQHLVEPLRDVIEVRRTGMGFGRSVYRGDDQAAADWWLHGQNGTDFPVIHLRRRQSGGLFDQMAVRHAEALWEDAHPVWL